MEMLMRVVLQGGKRGREEAASALARQGWLWCHGNFSSTLPLPFLHILSTVSNNPKVLPSQSGFAFSRADPEKRTAVLILQLVDVDFGRFWSCGFALGLHTLVLP